MLKMKKFPVKIDLSTFFEDERKYVIILVDPLWENVEYLQRRVEKIFDVQPVRFLTTENLFIPPQESIEILEFTESLKAFIPKRALEESRRRSKQLKLESQAITNNKEESVEKNLIKKRKYYTLGTDILGSSTPNMTRKSRRIPRTVNQSPVDTKISVSNESQEITSTVGQVSILKGSENLRLHLNKSVEKKYKCGGAKSSFNMVEKQNVIINNSEEKATSKRKRSHKESSLLPTDFEQEIRDRTLTLRQEVPSSTFLNHSKPLSKSSHIYFEDSTFVETTTKEQQSEHINNSSTNEKANSTKVYFKCKLNDAEFEKPLVFPLQYINKNSKPNKSIIDIQENILLQPANIDILFKAPVKNNIENQLDENVLSNTFNSTENKESETMDEIVNVTENEDNFKLPNNGITKNIGNKKNLTTDERTQNGVNISNGLVDINCKRQTNFDIENETQENKLNEKSISESRMNAEEISIEGDNSKYVKEQSIINQSKAELPNDECSLDDKVQEKPVSFIDKMKQTDMTESKATNMSEMSNNSLLMDESSVIDLDDEDEDVIDLSDADDQQKSSQATSRAKLSDTLNKSLSKMSIDEMLPFCMPLAGTPELNDVIVFKFNRVSGAKIDESQFIACRCEHINRRTKVLKLAVISKSLLAVYCSRISWEIY